MDTNTQNLTSRAILKTRWEDLQQASPDMRIREAARRLGVSEAELLATTIGPDCIRLQGDWQDFLKQLPSLGYVMSLTRNESCVLEHKGVFEKVNTFGTGDHQMGISIGPIETRVFFRAWHVAFAVQDEKNGRQLVSLQVFDKAGEAVTKIYLEPQSNEDAYWQIVEKFRAAEQSSDLHLPGIAPAEFGQEVDREAFLSDWAGLKDTHDFFPMLKKYNLHRYHALELAMERYTEQVAPAAIQQVLEAAAKSKLPIMIFAGNSGNLQIHQGPVRTIRLMDRGTGQVWLNVLDPEFNMHLRQDHVHTAWIVKKPTKDGIVTSLELYDSYKNLIAQFFGLRKPGQPQKYQWAQLLATLDKR